MESNSKSIEKLSAGLGTLASESTNAASAELDEMSPLEIARLMNDQDKLVALAVEKELVAIGLAIDVAAKALARGGRIVYLGAGTSGRLGVLDAAECPPTFSVSTNRVIALMAGGHDAMFAAKEGAEDSMEGGAADIARIDVGKDDVVVGLTVSGRTPYVLGGVARARELGAKTVGITNNENSLLGDQVDISIAPIVGPEVLTGSTRLKSGSAQKMVLNMISTGAMVRIGKCYGNSMVGLKASNEKLKARALKLVKETTSASNGTALEALDQAGWNVKTAILAIKTGMDPQEATQVIKACDGHLRRALEKMQLR